MMRSSEAYSERLKDTEYLDLIKERDHLIQFITEYDGKDIAGDRCGEEWSIHLQPDVRYQLYLEYLGRICMLMSERYNKDYVWGDWTLHEDTENKDEK